MCKSGGGGVAVGEGEGVGGTGLGVCEAVALAAGSAPAVAASDSKVGLIGGPGKLQAASRMASPASASDRRVKPMLNAEE